MSIWSRATRTVVIGSAAVLAVLGSAPPVGAHPLNTSAVLLDIGTDAVTATIELPLDQLSVARDQQLTATTVLESPTLTGLRAYVRAHVSASDGSGRTWTTQVVGGHVAEIDGADNLVLDATLRPDGGTVGSFVLHDDAVVDLLISHRIFVSARYGDSGDYTTLAMLSWQTTTVPVESTAPPESRGFIAAVHLGFQHISSGSDHLLFLMMLLLPAPLVARTRRWVQRSDSGWTGLRRTARRVVHVVSAFALGHSVTLALGALGWVALPDRLVESGIALSVFVSAVHAIRPLVRRGEAVIGFGFGLLHGLAFAALLGQLDLSRRALVTTLLGFNLGIELTQLAVVALVMPSLVLLSATPLYPRLRVLTALVGAALATGWFAERVGVISTNPLEPVGNALVGHPLAVAGVLAGVAAVSGIRTRRATFRALPTQVVWPTSGSGAADCPPDRVDPERLLVPET